MLQTGQPAPVFTLPDADMEMFSLESLRGRRHAVLFFYPKDGTPYCTMEAADFSDHEEEFERKDCVICGVSRDDCLRHADFRDENGLSIRLLSDEDGAVSKKYGVAQMKEKDGHRKLCVVRSTFIIDKSGIIRHAFYDINPKGHAAEIFRLVSELNGKEKFLC
ncbi:MAG: peroxiredoxin [Georgfuchsia sp.]